MKTKVCPDCGSDDVEELVVGWQKVNEPDAPLEDISIAELYSVTRWCNACAKRDPEHSDDGCGPFKEVDRA